MNGALRQEVKTGARLAAAERAIADTRDASFDLQPRRCLYGRRSKSTSKVALQADGGSSAVPVLNAEPAKGPSVTAQDGTRRAKSSRGIDVETKSSEDTARSVAGSSASSRRCWSAARSTRCGSNNHTFWQLLFRPGCMKRVCFVNNYLSSDSRRKHMTLCVTATASSSLPILTQMPPFDRVHKDPSTTSPVHQSPKFLYP